MDYLSLDQQTWSLIAANGVAYGPARQAASSGTAGAPLVPRAYRSVYGENEAPTWLRILVEDPDLTLGDLDVCFWGRSSSTELSKRHRRIISRDLGRWPYPTGRVAILAGLPLKRIAELPVRSRTCTAIQRVVERHGEGPFPDSLRTDDVMSWRGVGPSTLIDLLCVIESAELTAQSVDLDVMTSPRSHRVEIAVVEPGEESADDDLPIDRPVPWSPDRAQQLFGDVVSWAVSETDAVTVGDAFTELMDRENRPREWSDLTRVRLPEIVESLPHPYVALDEWVERLLPREARIFHARLGAGPGPKPSLAKVAEEFGVTREWIRQLERMLIARLRAYIRDRTGCVIGWRIDSLRRAIGVAAPMDYVEKLGVLAPPVDARDYSGVLLSLAGPYTSSIDWLVLKSAIETDPTPVILEMTDRDGCVRMGKATELLTEWGLADRLHLDWLCRDGWFRLFDNRLVRWKGPLSDKLAFSLSEIGEPATPQALLDRVGLVLSVNATKNALARDDRFCRVSRTKWGFVSWGLPEYKGIAASIRSLLEREGAMRIDDVVARLRSDFGTRDGSVRAYCGAPAFVAADGWIRLRHEDEPYTYRNTSIMATPGLFHLGPGRIGLLFPVDKDVLRGSGRPLSMAAAANLRIVPHQVAEFQVSTGGSLTVTFPDTTINGPGLGSTRLLAEERKAQLGDYMTLVLDANDRSAESTVFHPPVSKPSWSLVERLAGLRSGAGLPGLSEALGCDPEKVVPVLYMRGDDLVVEAMPEGTAADEVAL